MANVSNVKAKFFEPQGVSAALVSASASAGNIVFKNTSITGTSLLTIPLTGAVSSIDPYIPDNGVLFDAGAYVNLTAADVTGVTVYYDG